MQLDRLNAHLARLDQSRRPAPQPVHATHVETYVHRNEIVHEAACTCGHRFPFRRDVEHAAHDAEIHAEEA